MGLAVGRIVKIPNSTISRWTAVELDLRRSFCNDEGRRYWIGQGRTRPTHMRIKHAVGLLLLVYSGCSKNDATAPTGDPTIQPKGTPSNSTEMNTSPLGVCIALPRLVATGVYSSRSMLVEGVYFATAQSGAGMRGQITSTGTITLSQIGAQYDPTPTDRLIGKIENQVHEFVLSKANGNNMADSAISWLASPHELEYTHTIPNQAEAHVSVKFDGRNFEVAVTGWAKLLGQRYDVNLAARGGTQGVRDFDGQDIDTQYQLTGTVKGNGVEVDVQETHVIKLVSATSLQTLPSMRGTASQLRCVLNSVVRDGKDSYRFNNVQVEAGTKEKGGQSSAGIVAASGSILKNDRPFGECSVQNGALVVIVGNTALPIQLGG